MEVHSCNARPHSMEDICLVAPSHEVRHRLLTKLKELKDHLQADLSDLSILHTLLRPLEKRPAGFNDGLLRPGKTFTAGTTLAAARAPSAQVRGVINVIVVLVDFPNKKFGPAQDTTHYAKLWFEEGSNSVKDFYHDVSDNLVDIQGQVVGPYHLPHPIKYYSNGANGLGKALPNARAMAREAATLASPDIDFSKYDINGDGYVDAFVVIHARMP